MFECWLKTTIFLAHSRVQVGISILAEAAEAGQVERFRNILYILVVFYKGPVFMRVNTALVVCNQ
jgi:hypothetical protein